MRLITSAIPNPRDELRRDRDDRVDERDADRVPGVRVAQSPTKVAQPDEREADQGLVQPQMVQTGPERAADWIQREDGQEEKAG